jgi:RsiW-degrading membrane proteinase PrsW (M82 family)
MTATITNPLSNARPLPSLVGTRKGALYWSIAGLIAFVMLVTGLLTLIMYTANLGPVAFFVAAVLAALPVPIYLGLFLWLDRFEPEPPLLLLAAFLWGATVSILVAGCLNTIFGTLMAELTRDAGAARQLMASFSAPLMEETLKGTALLLLYLMKREDFDGILDGIIYAGVCALGFAMVENVQYYGGALLRDGAGGLSIVVILRGGLMPYTHVLFTSMTGIGFGLAIMTRNPILKFVYPIAGYFLAMFLHFLWNTIPALGGQYALVLVLVIYFIFWVPVFGILIGLVFWSLRRESQMITEQLGHYVQAGELTVDEATMLARLWPRFTGMGVGPAENTPWGVRRKYTKLATALAFYRHRVATGHSKANAEAEALHLAELQKLREAHGLKRTPPSNIPNVLNSPRAFPTGAPKP